MAVLGFNYSLNNDNGSYSGFLLKNTEALSQETITYTRGYTIKPVKKCVGTYVSQSSAGAFPMSRYVYFDCCLESSKMDGCDFNGQDSECED